MSEKMNCNVIQDLLPSYIDGLCSEESRQMVESHIKECDECAAILASMKEDIMPDRTAKADVQTVNEKKIIQDVNKKIKQDMDRQLLLYRSIIVIIVLGIFVMLLPIKTVPKSRLQIEYQSFDLSESLIEAESGTPDSENTVYLTDDEVDFNKAQFYVLDENVGFTLKIDTVWASKHDYVTTAKIISKYQIKDYSYIVIEENGKKILCLEKVKTSFIGGESDGDYVVNILVPDKIDDYRIY